MIIKWYDTWLIGQICASKGLHKMLDLKMLRLPWKCKIEVTPYQKLNVLVCSTTVPNFKDVSKNAVFHGFLSRIHPTMRYRMKLLLIMGSKSE
jgi:hypothetical protein